MKTTRKQNPKSTGLGDTAEKVFKATGIDKLAKWTLGEACGCDDRREALNKLFPYRKPECLLETEYNYLDGFFSNRKNQVSPDEQKELLSIYNRVFNDKAKTTSCSKCFLIGVLKKLEILHKEYKE